MVEPTNELMFTVLRQVQEGLADLRSEVRAGFARMDSEFRALRHHQIGLQVDQEQFRVDLTDLKARVIALEVQMARRD